MSGEHSVTHWLARLREGDGGAAEALWDRYGARLVQLARRRLRGVAPLPADEEDIALSAFDTFCRRAAEGRFPVLAGRDELWRLLCVITARKASQLLRTEGRRGGGRRAESGLADCADDEPPPEFAAAFADECRRLFARLPDDLHRQVAAARMEGLTEEEIADRIGRTPRTVQRKLTVIRALWAEEFDP